MTRKSREINRTSFSGIAGMFTRSLRKTATPDARVSAQGLRKGPRCIVLLSFIYAQVSTHFLFALTLFSSSFTVSLFIYFFSCSRVSNANRKKRLCFHLAMNGIEAVVWRELICLLMRAEEELCSCFDLNFRRASMAANSCFIKGVVQSIRIREKEMFHFIS